MLLTLSLLACTNRFGEGTVPIVPPGSDSSVMFEGGSPPTGSFDSAFFEDSFVGGEVGLEPSARTTGSACATDDDCDPTGAGINICTMGAFGGDSLYPTSVCIGRECDPAGIAPVRCDDSFGVCLRTTSGGICLPMCSFVDSVAPPKGCVGKNRCQFHALSPPDAIGVGFCFGGCIADADCPTGNRCQLESALCVKTPVTYVKALGDACNEADSKDPEKCNCYRGAVALPAPAGYCTRACRAGLDLCPSDFVCDPELPTGLFTKLPEGLGGSCLKICATDAECAGLNAKCIASGGLTVKTCKVK